MAKGRPSKRIKTAEQIEAEALQKMRDTLMKAGVAPFRVEGAKVKDFGVAEFTDIHAHRKERRQVLRILYPSVVDRWFAEGGPGFDEPQKRAVDHCRKLWACLGTQRLCANYNGGIGGGNGDGNENEIFARVQLAEYEREIPRAYWMVFESVVRDDMPAGKAGTHLANNDPQRIASAKATVGFIASKIAEWRGY